MIALECPALPAGPAADQDPNINWGGVATLNHPGNIYTGVCLGQGNGQFQNYHYQLQLSFHNPKYENSISNINIMIIGSFSIYMLQQP